MNGEFLIWSNERGAFWRPARRGYTRHWQKAGHYTEAEATKICDDANRCAEKPKERMIRLADLLKQRAFPIHTEIAARSALVMLGLPENAPIAEHVRSRVFAKYPNLKAEYDAARERNRAN